MIYTIINKIFNFFYTLLIVYKKNLSIGVLHVMTVTAILAFLSWTEYPMQFYHNRYATVATVNAVAVVNAGVAEVNTAVAAVAPSFLAILLALVIWGL